MFSHGTLMQALLMLEPSKQEVRWRGESHHRRHKMSRKGCCARMWSQPREIGGRLIFIFILFMLFFLFFCIRCASSGWSVVLFVCSSNFSVVSLSCCDCSVWRWRSWCSRRAVLSHSGTVSCLGILRLANELWWWSLFSSFVLGLFFLQFG